MAESPFVVELLMVLNVFGVPSTEEKYPLVSTMTSEELLPDLRLIWPAFPPVPKGTRAALDSVTPAVDRLRAATFGSVPPAGPTCTNPKPAWPPLLVTVR